MDDDDFNFDEHNTIIEDWLNGAEIDPTDYTAYQMEELREALGYGDSDSTDNATNTADDTEEDEDCEEE